MRKQPTTRLPVSLHCEFAREQARAAACGGDRPLIAPFQPPLAAARPGALGEQRDWVAARTRRALHGVCRHWQVVAGTAAVVVLLTIAVCLVFWEPNARTEETPANDATDRARFGIRDIAPRALPDHTQRPPVTAERQRDVPSSRQFTSPPPFLHEPTLAGSTLAGSLTHDPVTRDVEPERVDETVTSSAIANVDLDTAGEPSAAAAAGPGRMTAPCTPAEAARWQADWASHLKRRVLVTNSVGIRLALIPPGQFQLGSPDSEPGREEDEGPRHRVEISNPYYMAVHETTVGQFAKFISATGYRADYPRAADSPAVYATWNDARVYCEWLSKREGKRYRLPTEAEWEYAARVGTETAFYGGNEKDVLDYGWFQANAGQLKPVGRRKPNGWGLYDMQGNAWEWCADWYGDYSGQPQVDPTGAARGTMRVVRGGGAETPPVRTAFRDHLPPETALNNVGFRIVCEIHD